MKKLLYAGVAACTISLFSCGKDDVEAAKGPDKTKLGPVEAMNLAKEDMATGKIAGLWDAFPASYQSDVESVIHDFAANVDAEVYNEAIKTLTNFNGLLKSKKDLITDALNSNAPETEKEKVKLAKENWDTFTGLLDAVLATDVKDVESLKKIKLAEMTAKVQPAMIKLMALVDKISPNESPVAEFKNLSITLVSEDGNKAVVKTKEGDAPEEEMTLVKTENRWFPEDLTKDWKKNMEEVKTMASSMGKMEADQKKQTLDMLKEVNATIKALEGANSKEEMEKIMTEKMEKLGPAILPLMSLMR